MNNQKLVTVYGVNFDEESQEWLLTVSRFSPIGGYGFGTLFDEEIIGTFKSREEAFDFILTVSVCTRFAFIDYSSN